MGVNKNMGFTVCNMNEKILEEIINWKYEGKYSQYNLESYEKLKERNSSIINSEKASNYLCYFKNNELIGYTNLFEKENGNLFLGVGLAPKYCGKGLGKEILQNTINKARKKHLNKSIVLQVRAWNKRAINCYKSIGFQIIKIEQVQDYNGNETEYVFMKYDI